MTAIRVSKSAALGVSMLLLWQAPLFADDAGSASGFIEPPPWQEQATALPAYPADADLLPFPVDQPALSQTFNIDSKSLSVGTDGVARYSVVIVSGSGARNVLFEGMRCATREFRTYAYGEAAHAFHPAQNDKWQRISQYGWAGFRAVLLRDYLCDSHLSPYHVNEIKYRLSHPPGVR
jgi:hypothetical protein